MKCVHWSRITSTTGSIYEGYVLKYFNSFYPDRNYERRFGYGRQMLCVAVNYDPEDHHQREQQLKMRQHGMT